MRLLLSLVLVLALSGAAWARTVLVHPFQSDDVVLGTVVADRVAEALRPDVDLAVGPAAAPTLVPPFLYGGGFLSPLSVLEGGGVARLHGAQVLRAGVGVDLAASGRVVADDDGLRLELVAAEADGTTLATTLRAPEDRPEELARRAALVLASRLDLPAPDAPAPIDLAGPDDALGRAVALLAGGFAEEAEDLLGRAEEAGDASPRLDELREALAAVRDGRPTDDPALGAALALTVLAEDERTEAYVRRLAEAGVPAGHVWVAAIAVGANDLATADDAFAAAARAYPYGRAAAASYERGQGRRDAEARVAALAGLDDPAALVAAALLHELDEDPDLGRRALERLARTAPSFPWTFERLAYLAFDADDALAAAEALAVATELRPENPLHWTNLGWAWYLLGFWERSEAASERALELDPDEAIAAFNLGLVRARTGRLDEATDAYERALAADPEVDDEAVRDVEAAILDLPEEPALHYVLARLYAAEGRRGEAADAYERYLALGGWGAPFDERARSEAEALRAPPPPLEIAGPLETLLGDAVLEGPWRPGDPVRLRFEAITPGEELPRTLRARATLHGTDDGTALASADAEVEVPADAIGFVVRELRLDLPRDLAAGTYELRVSVEGLEDQTAEARTELEVRGEPLVLRRLVGRGVVLTGLANGRPLFDAEDVARTGAVVERLVAELHDSAPVAGEVLPVATEGRFAGLGGRELFETSDARDVRDFLEHLASDDELADVRLAFADAYAQWALEGAPER